MLYPQFYAQATSLDSAVGLPFTVRETSAVLLQPTGGTIRWRDDGGDPTSSFGQLLADGQSLLYDFGGIHRLSFIKASGTPVLNITYYGPNKGPIITSMAAPSLGELTAAGDASIGENSTAAPSLGELTCAGDATIGENGTAAPSFDELTCAGDGTIS